MLIKNLYIYIKIELKKNGCNFFLKKKKKKKN